MSHYRADLRAAGIDAILASTHFAGFNSRSAWAQNIDPTALPVVGIATPREDKTSSGLAESERVITAVVVMKRRGDDDLDDVLDADSVEAEVTLLTAFETVAEQCLLRTTEIRIDGDGSSRIGTLTMTFQVTIWLVDPIS